MTWRLSGNALYDARALQNSGRRFNLPVTETAGSSTAWYAITRARIDDARYNLAHRQLARFSRRSTSAIGKADEDADIADDGGFGSIASPAAGGCHGRWTSTSGKSWNEPQPRAPTHSREMARPMSPSTPAARTFDSLRLASRRFINKISVLLYNYWTMTVFFYSIK